MEEEVIYTKMIAMITKKSNNALARLYDKDETAWLEQSASLIREQKYKHLDYRHLAEYLNDMAKRDRKEVKSRLVQPHRRSRSWHSSILVQRNELQDELRTSKTLKDHAEEILPDAYARADLAVVETGLAGERFPETCSYTIDELLAIEPER